MAKINTDIAMIFMMRIAFLLNRDDLESCGLVSFGSMGLIYNGKSKKSKVDALIRSKLCVSLYVP